MRNAVIRKKHLKAQRILDDFIRMPRRILVNKTDIHEDWANYNNRLWTI